MEQQPQNQEHPQQPQQQSAPPQQQDQSNNGAPQAQDQMNLQGPGGNMMDQSAMGMVPGQTFMGDMGGMQMPDPSFMMPMMFANGSAMPPMPDANKNISAGEHLHLHQHQMRPEPD